MVRWIAAVLLATSACAHAATPFFLVGPNDPRAPEPNREPTALAAIAEYDVDVNIRGIAIDATADAQELAVELPGQAKPLLFQRHRLEPMHGFAMASDGSIYVDPDVPTGKLRYYWYGISDGAEMSFTARDGVIIGRIAVGDALYALGSPDKNVVLRELDPEQLPPEAPYPEPEASASALAPAWKVVQATPKYIDQVRLLVVHTANAVTVAGGQAAFDAYIVTAVEDLRTSLRNSDIVQVGIDHVMPDGAPSMLVNYNQSPQETNPIRRYELHRAFARTSPTVQAARNAHAADVVMLMVGDAGIGGIAYIQRPGCAQSITADGNPPPPCGMGQTFSEHAFAVSNTGMGVEKLSFAHEFGHLLGQEHNRANGGDADEASFLWSYGHYQNEPFNNSARTIMSYDVCPDPDNDCPRFMHFSNPYVNFLPRPWIPTGTFAVDGQGRYTFNARTAALLAPGVAAFRGPVTAGRIFRHGFEALPDVAP